MSKYPIAVVCVLAFIVGGVAAVVIHHSPRSADRVQSIGVQGAADGGAYVGHVESEEAAAASVPAAAHTGDEERAATADEVVDGSGDAAGDGVRSAGGVRARAATSGSAGAGTRGARGSARVSNGRARSGGPGVAGYAVGGMKKTGAGVKKTGAVIGKTFGKIGGAFHE